MELIEDMLLSLIENEAISVIFPNINFKEIVENRCYMALSKIKKIIENQRLSDEDCFLAIEEIICTLEEIGSNGSYRHDFG